MLKPGATAVCETCGTAVLLVTGPAVELWCHGRPMRAGPGVRCSEPVRPHPAGCLAAGEMYMDPATSATVRCTRAGAGRPKSAAGDLALVRRECLLLT
jgi:hypothetical protein